MEMLFRVLNLCYFLGIDYEEFKDILEVCDNHLDIMYDYLNPISPQ